MIAADGFLFLADRKGLQRQSHIRQFRNQMSCFMLFWSNEIIVFVFNRSSVVKIHESYAFSNGRL
jgi:hypothetical protein